MIKRYKKGKYGLSDFLSNQEYNGVSASGIATTAGSVIDALDSGNQYGRQSTGATIGKSALSGAALGLQTGNPYLAGAGLLVGGVMGVNNALKAKQEENKFKRLERDQNRKLRLSNTNIMRNANPEAFEGSLSNNYYKLGGKLKKFAMGGNPKPKLLQSNFTASPEALSAAQEATNFTKNWFANRGILTPEQRAASTRVNVPIVGHDSEINKLYRTESNETAGLNGYYDRGREQSFVGYTPRTTAPRDFKSTVVHETTHQFQDNLPNWWDTGKKIFEATKNRSNKYLSSPNEIHSKLMELRFAAGADPNKDFTRGDLRRAKRAGSLSKQAFKDLKGTIGSKKGIVNLLNTVAYNGNTNTGEVYAELGGNIMPIDATSVYRRPYVMNQMPVPLFNHSRGNRDLKFRFGKDKRILRDGLFRGDATNYKLEQSKTKLMALGGDPLKKRYLKSANEGAEFTKNWFRNRPQLKNNQITESELPKISFANIGQNSFGFIPGGEYVIAENKIRLNNNGVGSVYSKEDDNWFKMVGTHEMTHGFQYRTPDNYNSGKPYNKSKINYIKDKILDIPNVLFDSITTLNPTKAKQDSENRIARKEQIREREFRSKNPDNYTNPIQDSMILIDHTKKKISDPYLTMPQEVHARIMEWRRATNTKPTEKITPAIFEERTNKLNLNSIENNGIKQLFRTIDKKYLPELIDKTVYNNRKKDSDYRLGALGGHLKPLNSTDSLVVGRSHKNGGVKFPQQGIELEGDETKSGDFIFSKVLGFANRHKPLAKAKGKVEDILANNPNSEHSKNTLRLLDRNINNLKVEQEETKAMLGLSSDTIMATGGPIKPIRNKIKIRLKRDYIPTPVEKYDNYINQLEVGKPNPITMSGSNLAAFTLQGKREEPITMSNSNLEEFKVTAPRQKEQAIRKPQLNVNLALPSGNQIKQVGKKNAEPNYNLLERRPYQFKKLNLPEPKIQSASLEKKRGKSESNVNLEDALPFVSNAVNAIRKYPSIPKPDLLNPVSLSRVSLNAERAALNNELGRQNRSLEGLSSNSRSSARGSLLAKTAQGLNQIGSTEARLNSDIGNREAYLNAGIAGQNNALTNQYKQDVLGLKLSRIQNNSDNLANAVDKAVQIKQGTIDRNQETQKFKILSDVFKNAVKNRASEGEGYSDLMKELLGDKKKKKFGGKLFR